MLQHLKVTPAKVIEFSPVLFASQTAHITLENVTGSSVAFKIKTTAPKNYLVRPSTGMLEPHGTVKVQIILQPLKSEPESSVDRFSIQATQLEGDLQALEKDQWKTVDKSKIQDHRLTVVFTEPPAGSVESGGGPSLADGSVGEEPGRNGGGGLPVPSRAPLEASELKAKYDELVKYCIAVEKQKASLQRDLDALRQSSVSQSGKGEATHSGLVTHSGGFEVWHVVAIVIVVVIIVKMLKLI